MILHNWEVSPVLPLLAEPPLRDRHLLFVLNLGNPGDDRIWHHKDPISPYPSLPFYVTTGRFNTLNFLLPFNFILRNCPCGCGPRCWFQIFIGLFDSFCLKSLTPRSPNFGLGEVFNNFAFSKHQVKFFFWLLSILLVQDGLVISSISNLYDSLSPDSWRGRILHEEAIW